VQAFTKALELDPQMQVAQRNLEIALYKLGLLRTAAWPS